MDTSIPYFEDSSRVSASLIKAFKKAPAKAKEMLDGNGITATPAMEDGTMTHMYFLQNEIFKDNYRILDFEAPTSAQQKKFCEDYLSAKGNTPILKAYKAFELNYSTTGKSKENIAKASLEMALKLKPYIKYLRSKDTGRKLISWAKYNGLKKTEESIRLHKLANRLLIKKIDSPEIEVQCEFHINWEYKKDGIEMSMKSMIDKFIIDYEAKTISLVDIKTTSDINNFKKSFDEYEYGLQMAFYCAAIYWYLKNEKNVDPSEFTCDVLIVAIQGARCRVFKVSEDTINEKRVEIEKIIPEIYWHMTNDKWDQTRTYYEGDGSEPL
jgi:hypothetical protein